MTDAEAAKERKPIVFGSDDDYQLQQALNHLKGKPVMIARGRTDAAAKPGTTAPTK